MKRAILIVNEASTHKHVLILLRDVLTVVTLCAILAPVALLTFVFYVLYGFLGRCVSLFTGNLPRPGLGTTSGYAFRPPCPNRKRSVRSDAGEFNGKEHLAASLAHRTETTVANPLSGKGHNLYRDQNR
jgi:hypothetical protein